MRLVGGFGTLCDPLHSGFTEVFHDGEWGAICLEPFSGSTNPPEDRLVADVVCRQLGFPHGTLVIPREGAPAEGTCSQRQSITFTTRAHSGATTCMRTLMATGGNSRVALPGRRNELLITRAPPPVHWSYNCWCCATEQQMPCQLLSEPLVCM